MTIPFAHIPQNLRVPLFYAEVNNSQANTGGQNQCALIIGQKTADGLAPANIPLLCQGPNDAVTQGGAGSMLALMTAAYLANDSFGTLYYLPLADATGGIPATGTLNIGTNPADGDTITIATTVITFKASGAGALQVNIGLTPTATAGALLAFLQASVDANLVKCTYAALGNTGIAITSVLAGTAGNAYNLLTSVAAKITLSAATLLGGATTGTAAAVTIVFITPPTAPGAINLYIAGQAVQVPVIASETVVSIALAVAAAINANTNLPVTAVAGAGTGTVTITAKNLGLCGNDIDVRFNYRGAVSGELTPTGLTYSQTGTVSGGGYLLAGGTVNPSLTAALASLPANILFDFIVSPYTDATSMAAVSAFLNDTAGRWSWATQLYGGAFMASRGTSGTLTTLGNTMNDQHTSIMGMYDSPTPYWVWAAAVGGAAAGSLKIDPAVPLQTVAIYGVLAPPPASQFLISQQNTLLWNGISVFTVDQGGICHISNLVTTYQKNGFGVADDSYLEVETMFTLMYVLRFLKAIVTSKYARMKLAADGTAFAPGSAIVTPNIVKADLIAGYQQLCWDGECQNAPAFAKGLIVQQNTVNPNRLDVLYDAILIDQLRIFALLAQFRLI